MIKAAQDRADQDAWDKRTGQGAYSSFILSVLLVAVLLVAVRRESGGSDPESDPARSAED